MSTKTTKAPDHWNATPDGRVIDRVGTTICQCYQLPLDPISPAVKAQLIANTCNRLGSAVDGGLVLTDAEAKALRQVVRHSFDTEAQHYAECEPDERAGHIFVDLRIIALAAGEISEV